MNAFLRWLHRWMFPPDPNPPRRIMAKHFELKAMAVTCPYCAWHGRGAQMKTGEMHEDGVTDFDCPRCHEWMAYAPWPTLAEYRAAWDTLSVAERQYVFMLEERAA